MGKSLTLEIDFFATLNASENSWNVHQVSILFHLEHISFQKKIQQPTNRQIPLLWDRDMLQHGPIALAIKSWPKLCTCENSTESSILKKCPGFNHLGVSGCPTNLSPFKSNIQRILMKAIEMTAKQFYLFKELHWTLMPNKTTSMQCEHGSVQTLDQNWRAQDQQNTSLSPQTSAPEWTKESLDSLL